TPVWRLPNDLPPAHRRCEQLRRDGQVAETTALTSGVDRGEILELLIQGEVVAVEGQLGVLEGSSRLRARGPRLERVGGWGHGDRGPGAGPALLNGIHR